LGPITHVTLDHWLMDVMPDACDMVSVVASLNTEPSAFASSAMTSRAWWLLSLRIHTCAPSDFDVLAVMPLIPESMLSLELPAKAAASIMSSSPGRAMSA